MLGCVLFSGLIASSLGNYLQSRNIAERKAIEVEQGQLTELRHQIEDSLQTHHQNLLALHDVPPIQAILRAADNDGIDPLSNDTMQEWRGRLAVIFTAFLDSHPAYLQLRLIGADGNEQVRVQSSTGEAYDTPIEELQNKSDSLFVTETLKLGSNSIYHSDVSLNREYETIQLPYQPVFRLATPIYKDNGTETAAALLVVDISTEQLFNRVRTDDSFTQRSVVDERGNYIVHANTAIKYGFDLPIDKNFKLDQPRLAQLGQNQGQYMATDKDPKQLHGFEKIYFSPLDKNRFWMLAMSVPEEVVFADIHNALDTMLFVNLAIGVISLLLVVMFTTKRILQPVIDLANGAKKLQAGDLSVRVNAESARDEFYTLFSAINSFAENQQRAIAERDSQSNRLSAVIDNVVEGIITINENGILESFNPAAEIIFGYSESEVLGKSVDMLISGDYPKEHGIDFSPYSIISNEKEIGVKDGRILKGRHKNATIFSMNFDVSEFWIADKRMVIGVVRDITEQEKSEKSLIMAREEAEAANLAKTEFLSSMSHELRTPLNAILGFAQLLEMNNKKDLSTKNIKFVKEIILAGNHLLGLVGQVLNLSSIEEGQLDLDIQSIAIGEVMNECISQLNAGLPAMKGIELINNIGNKNVRVMADGLSIKQIIVNLISNAAKYNRENGSVSVNYSSVPGNRTRISISDTGYGISQGDITKLFEPFERLSHKHGTIEGSGIGLSVVKKLVEAMHGKCGVDSIEGVGSVFWFELPKAVGSEDSASGTSTESVAEAHAVLPARTKPLILYIEDNPANTRLVEEALSCQKNYKLISVPTAEKGLEIAQKEIPDLILMDIQLPGLNGDVALQIIKSTDTTCQIPVIAISAGQQTNLESHFDEYLNKPVNIEHLLQIVEKYLSNFHSTSPETLVRVLTSQLPKSR